MTGRALTSGLVTQESLCAGQEREDVLVQRNDILFQLCMTLIWNRKKDFFGDPAPHEMTNNLFDAFNNCGMSLYIVQRNL